MGYNKDIPNKEEKMQTKTYHVYKVSEGGLGQHTAKDIALRCGAQKVKCCTSHYIGQTWWDRTNRWALLGPDSPQIDQWHRSGIYVTGPRRHFRQIGNTTNAWRIWPPLST